MTNAFGSPPKAAIVFEGDFVAGVILSSTKSKAGTGFNAAPFPAITPGANAGAVEIGGDLLVTFKDTPAIRGMIDKVAYLIEWSETNEEFKPFGRRSRQQAQKTASEKPAKAEKELR